MTRLAGAALLAMLAAGCAVEGPPTPEPLGIAAEDLPPRAVSPEGVLGDAAVGADSLADPEIDTLGDPHPFL